MEGGTLADLAIDAEVAQMRKRPRDEIIEFLELALARYSFGEERGNPVW